MSNSLIYSMLAIIGFSFDLKYESLFWAFWCIGLICKLIEDSKK